MDYAVSLNALQTFGNGTSVTAHNLANMNTTDFRRWSHTNVSGSGESVRLHVEPGGVPGSTLPESPFTSAFPGGRDQVSLSEGAGTGMDAVGWSGENTVDLAQEMTSLTVDQTGFEANAAVIGTLSELDSTVLGLIVDRRA